MFREFHKKNSGRLNVIYNYDIFLMLRHHEVMQQSHLVQHLKFYIVFASISRIIPENQSFRYKYVNGTCCRHLMTDSHKAYRLPSRAVISYGQPRHPGADWLTFLIDKYVTVTELVYQFSVFERQTFLYAGSV